MFHEYKQMPKNRVRSGRLVFCEEYLKNLPTLPGYFRIFDNLVSASDEFIDESFSGNLSEDLKKYFADHKDSCPTCGHTKDLYFSYEYIK